MAEQEQVDLLKQGAGVWNYWRYKNPAIKVELSRVKLSSADLSGANLFDANLIDSFLDGADLSGAKLNRAKLSRANLIDTKLIDTNLSRAKLSSADLSGANLSGAVFLGSKLQNATLTGASIQDWNINTKTDFEGVFCDYIYLKEQQRERCPLTGNFRPGEFFTLVQKSLETIDLIFIDGIDWQAFSQSFQQLRSHFSDQEIGIQAIEKKGEAFVVLLETPPEANKSLIETKAKELYGEQLKVVEEQYMDKMKLQGVTLELVQESLVSERQRNTQLLSMVETMANKDKTTQNFNTLVGSVTGVKEGEQKSV